MSHGFRRLDLFVTEACNLSCSYCFAASKPRRAPSFEVCFSAIEWMLESDFKENIHITFWGGEPLLRADLLRRMVPATRALAKERDIRRLGFSMPTNATLLDEELLRWIVDEGIEIFASIDGDEATQAGRPLRSGLSSHELAKSGLTKAIGAPSAKTSSVRMTVTPSNVEHLLHNVTYFVDLGVRKLLAYPAYDSPWSDEALEAWEESQMELAEEGLCRWGTSETSLIERLDAWRPILRRLLTGRQRQRSGPLSGCGAGSTLIAVSVDGTFHPCHRFAFYGRDSGDVIEMGSLSTGLQRSHSIPTPNIEEMSGSEQCLRCRAFDLCTYGCSAINYATTHSFTRIPIWACALIKSQIKACQRIHDVLGDDPRYARALGMSTDWTLKRTSHRLGHRAWELLQGT